MNINLVIYNHFDFRYGNYCSIDDQIDFITQSLKDKGCSYTVSTIFDPYSLNIVIENFTYDSAKSLIDFCKQHGKYVLVVMTEHLNLSQDDKIRFGNYTTHNIEYIQNVSERIHFLCSISEYVIGYLTLGELPYLFDIDKIFSISKVHHLDYPKKKFIPRNYQTHPIQCNLSFTGFLTEYRTQILNRLSKDYRVEYYSISQDAEVRRNNNLKGAVSLNIPQNKEWKWISPMRIIYSLSLGIPCVHIGEGDSTRFYKEVLSWVDINSAISDPDSVWEAQVKAYNNLDLKSGALMSLLDVWECMEEK